MLCFCLLPCWKLWLFKIRDLFSNSQLSAHFNINLNAFHETYRITCHPTWVYRWHVKIYVEGSKSVGKNTHAAKAHQFDVNDSSLTSCPNDMPYLPSNVRRLQSACRENYFFTHPTVFALVKLTVLLFTLCHDPPPSINPLWQKYHYVN